jgi:hypothetical protein
MEFSSPLAAMRPQPAAWGGGKDLPMSRSMYQGCQTYGPNSFNFKDMSMDAHRKPRDYFTLKPVRGSSPTSSLTADLDANFHIDKRSAPHSSLVLVGSRAHYCSCSPQARTPRRSLFTADLFKTRDDAGECCVPLPLADPACPTTSS